MVAINFHDAQQALGFIQPQLLRINTEIEQEIFPDFDYARLMYVNTEGDMWDIGSLFYSGTIAGAAEFLSHKGFDMPYADVATGQHLQANHFAGIGYEWTLGELNRAAKANRNLGNEKARSARIIAESFCYRLAIRGSGEKNMRGIINDLNVSAANVQVGEAGSTLWAQKTPAEQLRDVNTTLNAPYNATLETQRANTLMLPTTRLQDMAITIIPGTNVTVLAFIRANNTYTLETGQPLMIIGSRELEAAGAGGTARMVAYDNRREVVQFHLPGPHEFLPPFQKSEMAWSIGGIMNVGGVEIRRPKAFAYRDGI